MKPSLESSLADVHTALRAEKTTQQAYEDAGQAYEEAKSETTNALDSLLSCIKVDFVQYTREHPHSRYKTIEIHLSTRPSADDPVGVSITLDRPVDLMSFLRPNYAGGINPVSPVNVTTLYEPFTRQLEGLVVTITHYLRKSDIPLIKESIEDDEGPYPERLGRHH